MQRSQSQSGDGRGGDTDFSAFDSEIVQLRSDLAKVKGNSEVERTSYQVAIDEKEQELAAEIADRVSLTYITKCETGQGHCSSEIKIQC